MSQFTSTQGSGTEGYQPSQISTSWTDFTSAQTDAKFCQSWLALQCSMIPAVNSGLLLVRESSGEAFAPAAIWPDTGRDLSYLGSVSEQALREARGSVYQPEAPDGAEVSTHVAYPVVMEDSVEAVVALDLQPRDDADLQDVLRQLLWGAGWLDTMFRRHRAADDGLLLDRAATGLELVQVAQAHKNLNESCLALVNELATRFGADRVSIGVEGRRGLKLKAISRAAWFDRKSQMVEAIENAMEEAIDQEASAVYPPDNNHRGRICVAQRDLAKKASSAHVATTLLIDEGQPIGAITIEREADEPFPVETLRLLEVAGELIGPVLASYIEAERWFAGRFSEKSAALFEKLLGPRHPTAKLVAALVLLVGLFLVFADGDFRVTARTVIEGQTQRAAVAPYNGYIAGAQARAGDVVKQGQVLATLDDREIRLERARWESEREQAARKYREALAKRDATSSRVYAAQQRQAAAQLALAEEKLVRARIVVPMDSVVVWGDLSQMIGAPVERGEVLFELAPLGAYRVILEVDDRDIAYVHVGQSGELALAGLSDETLPFTVKSVTSVATAEQGRNFFRVEAEVSGVPENIRPGMEGVGKIFVEERKLVWIWTRNFVSWLRLAFWNWLP